MLGPNPLRWSLAPLLRRSAAWLSARRFRPSTTIGDAVIVEHRREGETYVVAWNDLAEVIVQTTPYGPAQDVFFVLRDSSGQTVVVPHDAADDAFIQRLERLPGFLHDKLAEAMRSTEEGSYRCWQRPAA